ncbi:hypothetical protein [Fontibacillus sp. BL9]|uniref:hypothetical protein n=1 Tax=Fontibacillus sp. BL9 TaxID=3389971 RepID=UPI00397CF985
MEIYGLDSSEAFAGTGTEQSVKIAADGTVEHCASCVTEELLERLAVAAEAGVEMLLVSGDADRSVPFEENGAILEKRYRSYGGHVTTILKPGGDHHPHGLSDVTPILEFVLKYNR